MSASATGSANDFALTSEDLDKLVLKHDERRSSSRFSYMVAFRIAPRLANEPSSFQTVMGRDISEGGISFFLNSKPAYNELQIELGQGETRILLAAQVVGSNPVVGLEPYHLVRCKFTGHVSNL